MNIISLALLKIANKGVWNKNLLLAAQRGDDKNIAKLLKRGVSIEVKDEHGRTPLMNAELGGHNETIQTLLDAGADVEATDNKGETPLMLAADLGHNEIVQTLLDAGADVEATDNNGQTPLMLAVQKYRTQVITTLLNAGVKVTEAEMATDSNTDVRESNFSFAWREHVNAHNQRFRDLGINQELLANILAQCGDGNLPKSSDGSNCLNSSPEQRANIVNRYQDGVILLNKLEKLKAKGYDISLPELEKNRFIGFSSESTKEWSKKWEDAPKITFGDDHKELPKDIMSMILSSDILDRRDAANLTLVSRGFAGTIDSARQLTGKTLGLSDLLPGIIPLVVEKEQQPSHVAVLQAGSSAQHAGMCR